MVERRCYGLPRMVTALWSSCFSRQARSTSTWKMRRGKLLLETGKVEVGAKDRYGQTPLSWAAAKGHDAVVKLLLETGKLDDDSKRVIGQTPLLRAAESTGR